MNGWKEKMQNKVSSLTEKEIEEFLNTIDVIDEEGSDDVVSTDDEDIDDGINLVDKFSFGCGELGISVSDLNLTLVTPTASVAREESSVNLHGDSTPPAPPKRPKTCAGVSSYIFRRFDGNVVQMRQKDEEISKIVWKRNSVESS